jgi:nicotinamide mononucleotide transporter
MSIATAVDVPVRAGAMRNIIESVIIGVVLTALSYVVGLAFAWIATVNALEAFAVFTSYMSTYLCVKERRFNYVAGAISTFAYAILFLQTGLLASAVLNFYLTPTLVYGWIRWRNDADTRPVTRVSWKMVPVYLVVAGLFYFGAVQIVALLGGTLAVFDSAILAGTVLAQFLLDNKKIENWLVWAVVNVLAIYVYATSGLALVAFQYVFFLANTVYGFVVWNRSRNETHKSVRADDSVAAYEGPRALDSVGQPASV